MICKNCGAIIRNNEEYCRKCGGLVINFKKEENKNLKNICVENNMKGKIKGLVNKFSNTEKKQHDVSKINKNQSIGNSISDLGKKVGVYINEHVQYDKQENITKEE